MSSTRPSHCSSALSQSRGGSVPNHLEVGLARLSMVACYGGDVGRAYAAEKEAVTLARTYHFGEADQSLVASAPPGTSSSSTPKHVTRSRPREPRARRSRHRPGGATWRSAAPTRCCTSVAIPNPDASWTKPRKISTGSSGTPPMQQRPGDAWVTSTLGPPTTRSARRSPTTRIRWRVQPCASCGSVELAPPTTGCSATPGTSSISRGSTSVAHRLERWVG